LVPRDLPATLDFPDHPALPAALDLRDLSRDHLVQLVLRDHRDLKDSRVLQVEVDQWVDKDQQDQ